MDNIESTPIPLKKNIKQKIKTHNYLDDILKQEFKNKFKEPLTLIKPIITLKLSKN